MPRNRRESEAPTLWTLELFASAADAESLERAAEDAGLDKFVAAKAIQRLGAKLGVVDLGTRVRRGQLTARDRELAALARRIVWTYEQMRDLAHERQLRTRIIRVEAFPAHIANFVAAAIGDLERTHPDVRVELVDLDRSNVDTAGGYLHRVASRVSDLAIAPAGRAGDLQATPLYRWHLVAATAAGHPLMGAVTTERGLRWLDIRELVRCEVFIAPTGHLSRDLFEDHARGLKLAGVRSHSDPDVLVSMALATQRVAVVPNDSRVEVDPMWPLLMRDAEPLGASYSCYWSADAESGDVIGALVERLITRAAVLRELPLGVP